ncbi:MAG: D-aminoacyl-tRNA deacylase [Treponema sp.]|nr:D-aminoacyl-tRNA deacylase [Treponema sp.]
MKAVVQRVRNASVTVDGYLKGSIGFGLLVYLGVGQGDSFADADWLAEKIINLRIFDDSEGKMNLSIGNFVNHYFDTVNENNVNAGVLPVNDKSNVQKSGILVISQFTLLGDVRKGRRPSWEKAAPPEKAKELYEYFILKIREKGLLCESGEFQARMMVNYTNDGPVTILIDSGER